jgi:2-phospho-L-lactate/phosphoenolpyruvate guanylyltransferase
MTTVIIPVKPLRESKTRLAHLLSPAQRAALMGRLLGQTLDALQPTAVSRILVVSRDEAVLQQAQAAGVETLREERPFSLNSAVTQAHRLAVQQGAAGVLILPADLPLVQTADIERLLAAAPSDNGRLPAPLMVICGDERQQGTNALLLTPPTPFTFHYGPDSFARHAAEAAGHGRLVYMVNRRSLQFDLDTEADWQRLQNNNYKEHIS